MYSAPENLRHGSGREGGRGESGQTGSYSGLPDQAGESTGECSTTMATTGVRRSTDVVMPRYGFKGMSITTIHQIPKS